jgi:hypothetical protein
LQIYHNFVPIQEWDENKIITNSVGFTLASHMETLLMAHGLPMFQMHMPFQLAVITVGSPGISIGLNGRRKPLNLDGELRVPLGMSLVAAYC